MGLKLLFEDRDLLIVDKPSGLLTMGTQREQERTAYFAMMDYVRKGNPKSRNRVFIVHRLDRDTSGVLLLAKSEQVKHQLQEEWDRVDKRYLAVVRGHPKKPTGLISSYLAENVAQMVYSTDDRKNGLWSETEYRVLKKTTAMALVEVRLLTGRKNQIRVHFSDEGFPIVGDRKYGDKRDTVKQMALHAYSIEFPHPYSGKPLYCTAPPPVVIEQLVGKLDGLLEEP